jgi:hypothetical protein
MEFYLINAHNTSFASGVVIRQRRTGSANLELCASIKLCAWLKVKCFEIANCGNTQTVTTNDKKTNDTAGQ